MNEESEKKLKNNYELCKKCDFKGKLFSPINDYCVTCVLMIKIAKVTNYNFKAKYNLLSKEEKERIIEANEKKNDKNEKKNDKNEKKE